MIQAIGFIIGFYVLTRMVELIQGQWTERKHRVTLLFAGITIIVDVVMMLSLAMAGSSMPTM